MPEIIDTPKKGRKPSASDLIEAPIDPVPGLTSVTATAVLGDAVHLVANIALPHNVPTEVPNDDFTKAQVEAGKWTLSE